MSKQEQQEQERLVHSVMSASLFAILDVIITRFNVKKEEITKQDTIAMAIAMSDLEMVMHKIINRKQNK